MSVRWFFCLFVFVYDRCFVTQVLPRSLLYILTSHTYKRSYWIMKITLNISRTLNADYVPIEWFMRICHVHCINYSFDCGQVPEYRLQMPKTLQAHDYIEHFPNQNMYKRKLLSWKQPPKVNVCVRAFLRVAQHYESSTRILVYYAHCSNSIFFKRHKTSKTLTFTKTNLCTGFSIPFHSIENSSVQIVNSDEKIHRPTKEQNCSKNKKWLRNVFIAFAVAYFNLVPKTMQS